eukprot:m.68805 g.68805  ORF g.68805 m.68805 type:complete len:185 (-) comp18355_c0_seq2:1127-1681(-)
MVGVVVDVAFPARSDTATFKVQLDDGSTWWYNESSLLNVARPIAPSATPPATPTSPPPEPKTPENDTEQMRKERLSTEAIVSMAAKLRAGTAAARSRDVSAVPTASGAPPLTGAAVAASSPRAGGGTSDGALPPSETGMDDLAFMLEEDEHQKSPAATTVRTHAIEWSCVPPLRTRTGLFQTVR